MRSFASNAQKIVSIILCHHYPDISDSSQHKIAINKSLSIAQPLIVPIEKADQNCIPLEDFLALLDEKLVQEQTYIEEILQFKDAFSREFDQLCESISDKKLIMFIRNQRQRIIDCIFDSLKFEKRQIITKFYDNMMSGYDNEAIKNFEKVACNALWKPLQVPLPLELTEKIKNAVKEIKNEKSEQKIEEITSSLILFVDGHFKTNEVKLSAVANATDFKNTVMELIKLRKTCSIDVDTIDEDNLKVIQEFKPRCMKRVSLILDSNNFNKMKLNYSYNYLQASLKRRKFRQMLTEIPRNLKSLALCIENAKNFDLKILRMYSVNLNSMRMLKLNLSGKNNIIGETGMLSIAHLISKNKQLKIFNLNLREWMYTMTDTGLVHLSIGMSELFGLVHLELDIKGENIFGDGMNALSKSLQIMNKMNHLNLDFHNASITTSAIDHLAASIGKMNQMKYLNLDFSWGNNSAKNNSMRLFAQAISEMPNLNHLQFDFGGGNNEITDDGIVQLSQAIIKCPCIQKLILLFANGNGGNCITDKGIEELSHSICHLSSIQQLKLNFSGGNHRIGDKGMQALAVALNNTNSISDLVINFNYGNNSITDASMDFLADALKRISSELSIDLHFESDNNSRVTAKGESVIRYARTYSKIKFDYGDSWFQGRRILNIEY